MVDSQCCVNFSVQQNIHLISIQVLFSFRLLQTAKLMVYSRFLLVIYFGTYMHADPVRIFSIRGLTVRSLIHLVFILYMVLWSTFTYSLHVPKPILPAPLVEETVFLHCVILPTLKQINTWFWFASPLMISDETSSFHLLVIYLNRYLLWKNLFRSSAS